jgi:hypothetical protein
MFLPDYYLQYCVLNKHCSHFFVGFLDPPAITGHQSTTNWDDKYHQPQLHIYSILLFFKFLSKVGTERIFLHYLYSHLDWFPLVCLSVTRTPHYLYYDQNILLISPSTIILVACYISIKCKRNSQGMVHKYDMVHTIQSKDRRIWANGALTIKHAWCLYLLGKIKCWQIYLGHTKDCACQISLPTSNMHTSS